jgi:regulatory protein
MFTITLIEPQKLKRRVNIYLDGKFGFGLDLENFVKSGLKVGQQLSEEKVDEITKKAEFQKALDRLLVFTTLRPRSEKEIRGWLIRKKVNENFKAGLLEKLKNLDLLDDEKFAKWWVEQRLEFRSKSKRELDQELRNKGIQKDIIDKALSGSEVDEAGSAKKLIEKNMYKWSRLPKRVAYQKMSLFLARKGFRWEVIRKVTNLY